ncbi:unnamed protein product [Schistosoma curassoni]|uniref:Uncharacterized protein n=1 Tax=Schistosoma curassoni TaxID=6186 RepID=A0A183JUN9_9TREM|nr:unnamed protein product [Schistosoma curassoni]
MSISETCPVVGSNPIESETPCTNTDLSSSQTDDVLLNAHEIIAVPAHEETEDESSSIMETVPSNGAHRSTTKVSDQCIYWSSLVLSNISYPNDSYAFDHIYKNEKNLSDASNGDQEPNEILIDAVYSSDLLSTNAILKRSDENDLISSVADPHHLVSSSELSTQCGQYALNRVKLTATCVYEDLTLFREGG